MPLEPIAHEDRKQPSVTERLKEIWLRVLDLQDLSIHESFLDLGGDSLSAMLCISRMRDTFGVEFGLEDFFIGNPTIFQFAATIERGSPPQ
jgi:acyl carrier protein